MYVLSVQYSCAVVSFFCCGRKANLVQLTLFYSTHLTLIDGQVDGQRNKYTRFAWAGRTFFHFQLCCCVSFLFWREIGCGFTYYLCTQEYCTIKLWCCVSFFGSGRELVFGVLYIWYLLYTTVVWLCQFLVLAGNRFWFYILMYLEYNTIVVLHQFFGPGGKYELTLRTYLV